MNEEELNESVEKERLRLREWKMIVSPMPPSYPSLVLLIFCCLARYCVFGVSSCGGRTLRTKPWPMLCSFGVVVIVEPETSRH
jgi:hypothetical protein